MDNSPSEKTASRGLGRLILAAALCSGVATVCLLWGEHKRTEWAIGHIQTLGGTAVEGYVPAGTLDGFLIWLDQILGVNGVQGRNAVVQVDLTNADASDEDLKAVAILTDIRALTLYGPGISNAGLGSLSRLKRLEYLVLVDCPQVTDVGLRSLMQSHPRLNIIRRGACFMGVAAQAHPLGCELTAVRFNSPAGRAGLTQGDIILRFDGTDVRTFDELTAKIAGQLPGDKVEIDFRRGDSEQSTVVELQGWRTKTRGERR